MEIVSVGDRLDAGLIQLVRQEVGLQQVERPVGLDEVAPDRLGEVADDGDVLADIKLWETNGSALIGPESSALTKVGSSTPSAEVPQFQQTSNDGSTFD